MSFKEQVQSDNLGVFLNTNEFADIHTIKYGGNTYENIKVTLIKVKQSERAILQSDHMRGVYVLSAKAYFDSRDVNERIPKQGSWFEIDEGEALGKPFFVRYRVATAENSMGMICLELEANNE